MRSLKCWYRLALVALMGLVLLPAAAPASATETVGQQREGVLFWPQAQRDRDFSRMYRIFPSTQVAHGRSTHALPTGKPLQPRWNDPGMTLARYMQRYHVAGVMVLQDGHVRLQKYAANFGPKQRWTSFSVAKSVTSVLLGIALQQGYIHSLDNQLVTYIPELAGSAYADVTVRELLTMTSGVRWNEDYTDPKSDVAQMYRGACVAGQAQILPYLAKLPRAWPAGSHFNYNTAETDLLGVLVQRATHHSLATWLSQTIWKPYGMASDAYWIKDGCDAAENTGGSGLSATLADYARFGQFMLGGGRVGGKPVIAEAWLAGALNKQEQVADPSRGYGFLWWTDRDGSYAAIGIFGQLLYIDPQRKLVIAQVAAWPTADSDAEVAARRAFVAAIKRAADHAQTR
ncbi:MAG: class A beta-lactamase-related serine hydrolase [Rhodanobacteraceae bacterium]|nr:MAG: class A beta-lactamase-related serine hydrolase [Rhodanobacteraceae bacterium]